MLSLYRTLSVRYLGQRWLRAVLIVACIALGVGTLVATRALNETMAAAARTATNPMGGLADLVVSNGELPIAESIANELAAIPDVRVARPCIFKNIQLADGDERVVLLMGFDLEELFKQFEKKKKKLGEVEVSDETKNRFTYMMAAYGVTKGFVPPPALVGKELDRALGKDRTLRVKKNHQADPTKLFSAGSISAQGNAAVLGGNILLVDLAVAEDVLGLKPGQVNRIDLMLDPECDIKEVREEVMAVLAGRAGVRTPQEQSQSVENVLSGMQTAFSLCGIAALVVGLFLVYNALSISVAERRHEIGILLSIGASRQQIRLLFAGEAAVLGLAGSVVGIPLGLGLAHIGLQPVQSILGDIFMTLGAQGIQLSTGVIVGAVALGIITAVAAALVPAIAASCENPAAAVCRVARGPCARGRIVQIFVAGTLLVVGGGVVFLRGTMPRGVGTYGGMIMILIGALFATPLIAAVFARLIQPFARRYLGIEWRLAADNLVRSPGRTGLVIAALAAGVALVLETAGTIRSNRFAFRDWMKEHISSDLVISSGSPVGAGGKSVAMQTDLGAQIEALPEVADALPVRFRKVPFRDTQIFLIAVNAKEAHRAESARRTSAKVELYEEMKERPNTVIVSDNFAALHGLQKGDTMSLSSPKGPVDLKILGTIVDYSWNHGTIYVNRDDYLRQWGDSEADIFDVYLTAEADADKTKEMIAAKFGAQNGLFVLTRTELQNHVDRMIERIYSVAYAQQIVVMIVASLGVVTALLISVLQRRREMGLLRAIGASHRQVIRSVLCEACLMGIIGTAIGIAVGIPIEWYALQVVVLEETGFLFPVIIPWVGALIIGVAAMITATVAGLGPALYAVRQRIPEAIAYE